MKKLKGWVAYLGRIRIYMDMFRHYSRYPYIHIGRHCQSRSCSTHFQKDKYRLVDNMPMILYCCMVLNLRSRDSMRLDHSSTVVAPMPLHIRRGGSMWALQASTSCRRSTDKEIFVRWRFRKLVKTRVKTVRYKLREVEEVPIVSLPSRMRSRI